jgi:branched-chain amino acid transport system ATP-binding protein
MPTLLDVDGAGVNFGAFRAVKDVSLHVDEGAIVGLIGPNGAGKTTLFNAVTGLVHMDHGTVRFADADISRLSPVRRARLGIGRSFQNLGLMMGESVNTNVLAAQFLSSAYTGWDVIVRPWRWRRCEGALHERTLSLLDHFELTPHLRTQVADLSFASARFVELCGVLARRPRLVLLDEPTTGLSSRESDRLRVALLQAQRDGVSILVISHDVSFVMKATEYVYVLSEGHMLMEGTPDEVRRDPAVISAYLGTRAVER